VRNSKQGRSRLVPLHPSTVEALSAYLSRRSELLAQPDSGSFFVSRRGTRLGTGSLREAFNQALERRVSRPAPEMAVRGGRPASHLRRGDLLDWYRNGADVMAQLPLLSTFMGHVSPASTYWYLSASPELLAAAAVRLDPSLGRLS